MCQLSYFFVLILFFCPVFSTANRTCPMGYALCYGSRQCVLAYFFNDGENDCNVGTDEFDQYLGIQHYCYPMFSCNFR